MILSEARRFGARCLDRLRINSWCLTSSTHPRQGTPGAGSQDLDFVRNCAMRYQFAPHKSSKVDTRDVLDLLFIYRTEFYIRN